MGLTVKQVADLAGITVRTVHHYHRIGLLRPSEIRPNGYRIYHDADLVRLQQILFFRELGFRLRDIQRILDRPDFDRIHALERQRDLLQEQRARIDRLITTITRTLEQERKETPMNRDDMFDGFDRAHVEDQIARYRDESIERYGKEAVERSEERVRKLNQPDWDEINVETAAINRRLGELMESHPANSPESQEMIERWFRLLNRHFSEYSPEMFRGLGDLYVQDPRFTAHYDAVKPGLARYMQACMHAFADRHSGDRK